MCGAPQGVNSASALLTSCRSCAVGDRVHSLVCSSSTDVRALKAGLELKSQPPFDATDIMVVKDLGGQISDVAWLIPVEEAPQRHGNVTSIAVHRPRDERLDVTYQVIIRARPVPRLLPWIVGILGRVRARLTRRYTQYCGQTSLWKSEPVMAFTSILHSAQEYDPVTGIQGYGQRCAIVRMKAVCKIIHLL